MNWVKQCEELWGERWKSTLALTAGVKKRQVFRWFAGDTKLPVRVDHILRDYTPKNWQNELLIKELIIKLENHLFAEKKENKQ